MLWAKEYCILNSISLRQVPKVDYRQNDNAVILDFVIDISFSVDEWIYSQFENEDVCPLYGKVGIAWFVASEQKITTICEVRISLASQCVPNWKSYKCFVLFSHASSSTLYSSVSVSEWALDSRVFHKNTFLKEKVVHTLTTPYRAFFFFQICNSNDTHLEMSIEH